jgi:hypothetical protein
MTTLPKESQQLCALSPISHPAIACTGWNLSISPSSTMGAWVLFILSLLTTFRQMLAMRWRRRRLLVDSIYCLGLLLSICFLRTSDSQVYRC